MKMSAAEITLLSFSALLLLFAAMAIRRLRQPTSFGLWLVKVLLSANSPWLLLLSLITGGIAFAFAWWSALIGAALAALLFGLHIVAVTRPPKNETSLRAAFRETRAHPKSLKSRYVLWLPREPEPDLQSDLVFAVIERASSRGPGRNRDSSSTTPLRNENKAESRELLCDLWQPSEGTERSGLGFIYLHGSAWAVWDKDGGTRPWFRHLAAQGHTVIDVAYRLFPETDMMGMVHDAKRAIAWCRENAAGFQINPERIVLAGGSAGGHIALLSAYTAQNSDFCPGELKGRDLSVHGVVCLYGPADLLNVYEYCCQELALEQTAKRARGPRKQEEIPPFIKKLMGPDSDRYGFEKGVEPGILPPILGAKPQEDEEVYRRFSPIHHVHGRCPPTLLVSGAHDILVSPESVTELHQRLRAANIPSVLHMVSQADHAFDLIAPRWSPGAHNAIYEVDRFLATMT